MERQLKVLMEDEKEKLKTFVCFDIETTGLNPKDNKIIEIGALKVKDGKIVEVFSELIDPRMSLPEHIVELTGITDEMLVGAQEEDVVVPRFLDFLGTNLLLGHNVLFDYSFMKVAAKNLGYSFEKMGIDTLHLCKKLHPELKSRSLGSMCKYYNITNNNAHRAYDDAKATTLLYVQLMNQFYEDNPEVFRPTILQYKQKKTQSITEKQKKYLIHLLKYHKIESGVTIDSLTQREASQWIDKIILEKGRIIEPN